MNKRSQKALVFLLAITLSLSLVVNLAQGEVKEKCFSEANFDNPDANCTSYCEGNKNCNLVFGTYAPDKACCNADPTAEFDCTDEATDEECLAKAATLNRTVTFDASNSKDAEGVVGNKGVMGWDWEIEPNSDKSGETITHKFNETGLYWVNLTVADYEQSKNSVSKVIKVNNTAPNASFTFEPEKPEPQHNSVNQKGDEVTFDASGSTDINRNIDSYNWKLGNDITESGKVVKHTYKESGNYTVKLAVNDSEGANDTITKQIIVNTEPTARFKCLDEDPHKTREMIRFEVLEPLDPDDLPGDVSLGVDGGGSINWTFGDGNHMTGWRVHNKFDQGTYNVNLTVTDGLGAVAKESEVFRIGLGCPNSGKCYDNKDECEEDCTDEGKICQQGDEDDGWGCPGFCCVSKIKPPDASFTYSPHNPEVDQNVDFDASDSEAPDGTIESYNWDFNGDGTYEESGVTVEDYSFNSTGQRFVELNVTDNNSNSAIATAEVDVLAEGTCDGGNNCSECCDIITDYDCGSEGCNDSERPRNVTNCNGDDCGEGIECLDDPECECDDPEDSCEEEENLGCGVRFCEDDEMAVEFSDCDNEQCAGIVCQESDQCCEDEDDCEPGQVCDDNNTCREPENCSEVRGSACSFTAICQNSNNFECRQEFADDCDGTDRCCCAPIVEEPSDQCPEDAPFCVDMGNNESFCCSDQECTGGGGLPGPDTGNIVVQVFESDGDQAEDISITVEGETREGVDEGVVFQDLEGGNYDISVNDGEADYSLNFDPQVMGETVVVSFILGGGGLGPSAEIEVEPNNPEVGEDVTFRSENSADNYWWFIDGDRTESVRETRSFDNAGNHYAELIVEDSDTLDLDRREFEVAGGGNQEGCADLPDEAQHCMDGRCCTTLRCQQGGGGNGTGECPPGMVCRDGQCCMNTGGEGFDLWWCTGIPCDGGRQQPEPEPTECQTDGDCGENQICNEQGQCVDVTPGECDDANEPECDHNHNLENNTCQFNGEPVCAENSWECHNWDRAGPNERDCEQAECTGSGWDNSVCGDINNPEAAFNYDPEQPEPSQEIKFNASASRDPDGSINSYSWDLGSGATASGEIIHHTYSSEGDYTVNLTVTDDQGNSASITQEVRVKIGSDTPKPSFTYQPSDPAPNEEVTFDGSQSYDPDDEIESYQWEMGEGTSLMGETLTYTYLEEGNYTVRLTVTDSSDNSNSTSKTVVVKAPNQQPVVNFDYQPQDLVARDSAEFDAVDSYDPDGSIASYEWRRCRGQGNVSCDLDNSDCPNLDSFEKLTNCQTKEGSKVDFNFPETGHYFVELTLTDNENKNASSWAHIPVEPRPPTIKFKRDPSYVVKNKTIPIQVMLTKAPAGLSSYESLAIEIDNPSIASIIDATVSLRSVGNIDVSNSGKRVLMTGMDSSGEIVEGAREIKLGELSVKGVNFGDTKLRVDSGRLEDDSYRAIDYETESGGVKILPSIPPIGDADNSPKDPDHDGLFEDVDGNGQLEEEDWKLLFNNLNSVKTKYYKLRFDFTRDNRLTTGDVGELQSIISIGGEQPKAGFFYNPESPEIDQPVVFNASASSDPDGSITKYKWHFGDGATGNGVNLDHTYSEGGSYNVTLTVTDDQNYINSTTQMLTVGSSNQPPAARFSYSPQNLFGGDSAEFNASDSSDADGSIVSYSWKRYQGLGDASCNLSEYGCPTPNSFEKLDNYNNKEGKQVNFSFPETGHYFVELNVHDDQGGEGKERKHVNVGRQTPQVSLTRDPTYIVNNRQGEIRVTVDYLPQGLLSYEQLTIKIDQPDLVSISSAQSLLASTSSPTINGDRSQVTISGIDSNDAIGAGERDVDLANLTISGLETGNTEIRVTSGDLEEDNTQLIDYNTAPSEIKVIPSLAPVGDADNSPRDLNQDGMFEDVNGNGRLDADDWIKFFNHLAEIKGSSYGLRFDFNRDGQLGSGDVITLGKLIESRE